MVSVLTLTKYFWMNEWIGEWMKNVQMEHISLRRSAKLGGEPRLTSVIFCFCAAYLLI